MNQEIETQRRRTRLFLTRLLFMLEDLRSSVMFGSGLNVESTEKLLDKLEETLEEKS